MPTTMWFFRGKMVENYGALYLMAWQEAPAGIKAEGVDFHLPSPRHFDGKIPTEGNPHS